jgi:hypothetical protein
VLQQQKMEERLVELLALLGKLICIRKKFNEAASTFEILINTGNYRLVQTADLTAEQINGGLTFGGILKLKEKKWSKSLFEVQYTDVEGGNYGQLQFIEGM